MKTKKSLILISIMLITAFAMNACGAAAPAASVQETTLVSLCSDPRCGFANTFGESHFNVLVDRSVAGGAHVPPAGYIAEVEAATGKQITRVAIISHMCGDAAACGGLNGSSSMMAGTFNMPNEVGQYLKNSVPSPDEYYALFRVQKEYVRQGVLNGMAGIQNGLNGEVKPMFYWEDGKIIAKVPEAQWEEFLRRGGEIPSLTNEGFPSYMKELLEANKRAIPSYTSMSRALAFEDGSTIYRTVVTTSLDPAVLSAFENGSTYVVTSTRAMAADVGGELAYGLLHKKSLSAVAPHTLYLNTDSPQQLATIIGDLRYSPTMNKMIADAADDMVVVWWKSPGINKLLRGSNVPMSRLFPPVSGGSGPVTMSMAVPVVVDEVAVATTMADAGIPVQKASLARLVEVLRPFAGQTVRVLAIGLDYLLKANDIAFVTYVTYQVMSETGNVLFRYGPEWPLTITGIGGYDPTGGNAELFQRIYQNPMVNMQATSQYSTNVTSIWDHIQEQVAKGEQPCVFLTVAQDSQTPMPVVCAPDYVKDDPKGLVFYWPNGQQMSVPFQNGNWQTVESGKVHWAIDTMDPSYVCQGGAFVEGLPVTLYLRPECHAQ